MEVADNSPGRAFWPQRPLPAAMTVVRFITCAMYVLAQFPFEVMRAVVA